MQIWDDDSYNVYDNDRISLHDNDVHELVDNFKNIFQNNRKLETEGERSGSGLKNLIQELGKDIEIEEK